VGFFERPDPRIVASADPAPLGAVAATLKRHALAFAVGVLAVVAAYAADVGLGLRDSARTSGSAVAQGLRDTVTIVRDRRDVPHIRAANDHDLYFAEGYVQGSDRLFQLDLTRRYAYGRMAEVVGPKALLLDEAQRAADVAGIAARQLGALSPSDRRAVVAFSDGVNAAAGSQPLPIEFRMLDYRPAPWTPQDSLAVSVVASLELADSWHDVFARDAAWRRHGKRCYDAIFPLSDARYDVTAGGARSARRAPSTASCDASQIAGALPHSRPIGSNAWAAGSLRSTDGHALIANDPHLDVTIPGIWYLVDLQSPHVRVAGATIPGIPGVILGHNARVAWATTNADMATTSVFEAGRLDSKSWVNERFHVRFASDARVRYYRTPREFSVPNENDPSTVALVRWPVYVEKRSTIATALALDCAQNVTEALRVLASYRGSPQNFVVADRSGAVAYHVAGLVPNDPAWGRYVHPARDLRERFAPIAFARLPARNPSRDAVVLSANNKPYGAAYPYRLSAQFEPPYRAYRIAQLLRSRSRYNSAYFAQMQLDTLSPIDLEIARTLAQSDAPNQPRSKALHLLRTWDGRFASNSRAASLEHSLREQLFQEEGPVLRTELNALRRGRLEEGLNETLAAAAGGHEKWGVAGGMRIEHVLAPLNFAFLDGGWLPGAGDEYTIHLQEPKIAQGFRAVWDVGDWDRGGIAIPSGESGEPGSGHYTDLTAAWNAGVLGPLPFSAAAVANAATATLTLRPR
jgi:penicillin amidase